MCVSSLREVWRGLACSPMFDLKLAALATAVLRGPWPSTTTLQAGALWSEQPTVVYAIRRMG